MVRPGSSSRTFLSTPSARRATWDARPVKLIEQNFYPRPPRGGRHQLRTEYDLTEEISIHALREEGDRHKPQEVYYGENFYPRPPRGGRLYRGISVNLTHSISIHALREEGDQRPACRASAHRYFYPRPPRGGRRTCTWARKTTLIFLSTPSARRATICFLGILHSRAYFYPRPPRGGRLDTPQHRRYNIQISIHALREEGDLFLLEIFTIPFHISIHALREEGDSSVSGWLCATKDFYPRPPRGGRQQKNRTYYIGCAISIHALREEGDRPKI